MSDNTKYYRVIKENFLWEVGAVLSCNSEHERGYDPVEDIWNKHEDQTEYISTNIVEASPEYFERVYPSKGGSVLYLTAEQLKEMYARFLS